MQPYKLKREIQVNEKGTNKVVTEISIPNIDVKDLSLIIGYQKDDPFFYGDYKITTENASYFSQLIFEFNKYDYYLTCWRELNERELEILTINRFFKEGKAKRYVDFILKTTSRQKFISSLAHLKDLDFEKFEKVGKNEMDQILERVKGEKLDSCYVISENKRIDGQFLDVERAIEETIGYGMGTLLVFGTAKIVYYEGEEMNDRWISHTT
jgi:hypothetical protein